MKWAALLVVIAKTLACPSTEPTTIQIQNYDGPIFLHIPAQNDETCPQSCPTNQQTEIECTCIAKPLMKYIPINTASESSCHNRKSYRNYNSWSNDGTCTCGTFNDGKHCGTCTCGNNNSGNNGGTCTCGSYNNGKHCRTCACETNSSENSGGTCTCGTYNCRSCGGTCTCGTNNIGSCTCGTNDSGSCTCGTNNSGSGICGTNNGEMQFYNERGYKGIDKISYTLDIVKPRSYDSGYNKCICHKCPCY